PEKPHLGLEHAVRVGELGTLERVGADQLRQAVGTVGRRATRGTHLVDRHRDTAGCQVPGGLRARQAPTHDLDAIGTHGGKYTPWRPPHRVIFSFRRAAPLLPVRGSMVSLPQSEPNDLGFGAVVATQSRVRLMNRDGSFNVQRGSRLTSALGSPYHILLTLGWPAFLGVLATGYFSGVAVFSLIYFLAGPGTLGEADGAFPPGSFPQAFFFSV